MDATHLQVFRNFRAILGASILLLMAFSWAPVLAQGFCTSLSGPCYPTFEEAHDALRADLDADPARQFLEHVNTSIVSTNPGVASFALRVNPRAPDTASDAMYHAYLGTYGDGQFGCQSAVPGTTLYCYDEQDLLDNAVESLESRLSNDTSSCSVSVGPVAWDYLANGTAHTTGFVQFGSRRYRPVAWVCTDGRQGSDLHIEIFKRHVFTCEAGLDPIHGATVRAGEVSSTALCKSDASAAVIGTLAHGGQVASCKANPNPCHPATGEKSREEVDFEFAGRPFVRYYRSKLQFRAAPTLGIGWSHSLSDRLIETDQWMSGSGAVETFTRESFIGNRYFGVNSTDTILDRLSTSLPRYRLRTADGEVREFDNDRRLIAIRTLGVPQRDISLQYDTNGRLSRALDAQGRSLTFLYRHGRLWRIILPDGTAVTYTYDENTNLVGAEYADGTSRSYHYAESGLADPVFRNHLTGISDEHEDRYASFGYDSAGRVISSKLHAGSEDVATTLVSYGPDNTATVTTAAGGTQTYAMQAGFYRRINQIDGSAGSSTNAYRPDGRLQSIADKRGFSTSFSYSGAFLSQQIQAVGEPESRAITYQRDANGYVSEQQESMVDISGAHTNVRITRMVRDAMGRVLHHCTIDPAASGASGYACGSTTTPAAGVRQVAYSYCTQADVAANACPLVGLLISINGARSDVADVTSYAYRMADAPGCDSSPGTCPYRKGDLWKVTNALGHVTETVRYDGAGRPISVRDASGAVTDYEYHLRGWLIATKVRGPDTSTATDDRITRIEYWPTGLVKKVTQPDGAYTEYGYDAAHRLTSINDGMGNAIDYTLDNAGNRVAEDTSDAGGTLRRTLSRLYNQLGQLATQADASDNPTDFTYDPSGNLKTLSDPLSRVTVNDYDPLNRLMRTLQDMGGIEAETRFEHDALDNLTKVVDPKGLETRYVYDAFGNLLQLDSPDTGAATYTYDAFGNRIGQVDARGQVSGYTYDALNRLIGISYADAPDESVTHVYDAVQPGCLTGETFAAGRLTGMADASGTTQYCYDRFRQLVRKVQVTNGQTFIVRYAYDRAGRLGSLTYPDGSVVDYVRDAQGRVVEVGITSPGGSREIVLDNAGYYPFGPAAGWTYGNGRMLSRLHDLDYRSQAILDSAAGGLDVGFSYDPAGNLVGLHTADLAEPPKANFSYDGLSRLTAFLDGATGTTIESYVYDATGNRTGFTNAGGNQTYTYPTDSHRLSSVAGASRSYDAVGNTTAIAGTREFVYSAANRLSQVKQGDTVTMHYAYNGKGERVRRHLGTEDVTTVYDEAGRWLGDYDIAGTPLQQAIWLDDLPVGLLVGATAPNRLHYVQPDHLGTPRSVIDPIRNVAVWSWDLASEAFGSSAPSQDPDNDGIAFTFDMRFPGQRYDAASGLNYNYFRDYEPGTGRYAQSDPIGLSGGVSTFSYVSADPFGQYDPYGLEGPGSWTNPPPPDPAYAVAWPILRGTYREMLNKNVRGTDQFFHCLAACRATKQTGSPKIVLEIMSYKEHRDYVLNIFGRYGERKLRHGEMLEDMARDRAVNEMGAACPPEVDCQTRCGPLLDTLPRKHRKFMLNYRPDWR